MSTPVGDRLSETGQIAAAGDQRYLAEVLTRQIEYATAPTLHGGDEEDAELSRAVLAHLAPCTPVLAESLPGLTGARPCARELAERLDREHLHALLDSCLLTEEEALAGSHVWAGYDDPFAHILDLKGVA